MRRPASLHRLSVELSAEAWREIGALSGDEFSALRQHLDLLATAHDGDRVIGFRIGRIYGICERDLSAGTLKVTRLQRDS